jgi:hypothetical protein
MVAAADHRRLAITSFEERHALERTLEALHSAGLSAQQVCLIGEARAIADLVARETVRPRGGDVVALLFASPDGWTTFCDSPRVAATTAPVLDALLDGLGAGPSGGWTFASERSAADGIGPDHHGEIALVVRARDPQQHVLVTRTLLANSLHKVTTYDYAVPAAVETRRSV